MRSRKPLFDMKPRDCRRDAPLVVHIIYRLDVGGLENGLVNLINHMPVKRYRHAIVCLTEATDFRRRLRNPDIPIFTLYKQPGKDLRIYAKLWRVLRALRPAIVHTRNLGTLDAVIPAVLAGVRYRVHGEHGWDVIDLHGTARKYALLRRGLSPFIDRHIAVSRHIDTWLTGTVRLPERKVAQIYNGVDTTRFRPADGHQSLLPPLFADPDCVVIGTVGRMHHVKDPLCLVRAFLVLLKLLPAAARRLRLVMIGDGPLRGEALTLLERAGASALAWLPGARDDVAELLRTFDIFVLPSLNEGISNTILEAMATALPVIATGVGGNVELVDDGRSGTLAAAADPEALARAIGRYIENPALRHDHGRAGRARVERVFSLDAMVGNYLEMYDQVLAPNSRRAPQAASQG